MKIYLLALPSVTLALKAQRIFYSMSYHYCEVVRTPKTLSTGCGYSLKVKGEIEKIKEILRENNIPIKPNGIMEMGGDFGR